MKFLATGDDHWDQDSRFDECQRVHGWIAEQVEKEKPDAFLDGGDIYERASTPKERAAVADWLERIAEVCPVIISKGNHDRPTDVALLGKLKTRHQVTVEERAGVHVVGGIAVAAVAWPNRASIAAMMGRPLSSEAIDQVAQHELGNVLRGLGAELDRHALPRVLLGHFMIDGSEVGTGQPPLVGAEMRVHLADLALARPQITIASHVHFAQAWQYDGASILYCGAPYRNTFGELGPKSIVMADITAKGVTWSRLETPATRMVLLTGEWREGALAWQQSENCDGAEVRLRYGVDADQRDGAKATAQKVAAFLSDHGAVSVKIEEVVRATTRARTPEIALAVTIEDKLRCLWKAKGIGFSHDRERRLLAKLNELEAA
jgi:DNA repair exonuclease SbcCD nuclease subunit